MFHTLEKNNLAKFDDNSTTWEPVKENLPVTYHGGISEVG